MQLNSKQGELVKWYPARGFGFLLCDGVEVYVHRTSYLSGFAPELNQIVNFDFGLSRNPSKPPEAIRVRVVKEANAVSAERELLRKVQEELQKTGTKEGW